MYYAIYHISYIVYLDFILIDKHVVIIREEK